MSTTKTKKTAEEVIQDVFEEAAKTAVLLVQAEVQDKANGGGATLPLLVVQAIQKGPAEAGMLLMAVTNLTTNILEAVADATGQTMDTLLVEIAEAQGKATVDALAEVEAHANADALVGGYL